MRTWPAEPATPGPLGAPWELLAAAQVYLVLRDSTAALRALRYYLDSAVVSRRDFRRDGGYTPPAPFAIAMRLRGEVAAALGFRAEAIVWLDRLLVLWSDADAQFAGDIARLRALRDRVASK